MDIYWVDKSINDSYISRDVSTVRFSHEKVFKFVTLKCILFRARFLIKVKQNFLSNSNNVKVMKNFGLYLRFRGLTFDFFLVQFISFIKRKSNSTIEQQKY